jgi:hypothetical protein
MRALVTFLWGTIASVAIWLAGAHDVAYLGYLIVAMAREPTRARSCHRRRPGRSPS